MKTDPFALTISEMSGAPVRTASVADVPAPSLPVEPPPGTPTEERREFRIRKAAYFIYLGETQAATAALLGVHENTIANYTKTDSFRRAMKEFQLPAETRMRATRELLALRQMDYLEELDQIATDPNVPPHVRADVAKDLLNRDRTIPTLGKTSAEIEGGLVISEQALEKLGRAIGEGLRRDSERTVTVDAERIG
jgi:uncharacterized protein (UPF0147 family)